MREGNYVRGEDHPRAIMNEEKVRRMRCLHQDGMSLRKIATEFDIQYATAWDICAYKSWKHVL